MFGGFPGAPLITFMTDVTGEVDALFWVYFTLVIVVAVATCYL